MTTNLATTARPPAAPPRRRRRALSAAVAGAVLAALAAVGLPGTAHASGGTTYYVDAVAGSDSNRGTSTASPWKSLAKVDAAAFQPGDTVAFQGGETWTGGLTVTSSGTAAAPLTVTSYGTGRAVIAGQDTVQAAVTLSNVHDVHVTGLEVTNGLDLTASRTTDYRGIYVVAKDVGQLPGSVISNNYVHTVDGYGTSRIGEGGIAIGVRGNTTPTWFSGLQITGNEVAGVNAYGISTFTTWCADCEIYTPETGIPATEVSATRQPFTNLLIANNYVHDVAGGGITPQYADNTVVQGNTVDMAASHRLVAGGGNVGIWWQGTNDILVQYNTVRRTAVDDLNPDPTDDMAFDADMGTTGSTVQYNYSDSNSGGFFMCLISATNITLRYNISQNDHFRPFSIWNGCSNLRGYNNTVWSTTATVPRNDSSGGTTQQGIEAFVRDTAPYNNVLFDNIFYNPAHGSYACANNCGFNGTDSTMDYSHNLYWDGTAGSTVVPANDPAPVVADPRLTNPGNAVPPTGPVTTAQLRQALAGYAPATTSPVRNAGVSTATAPPVDLFGTAIPAGAPDLGAWQHPVTATASTTLGTSAGAVANITDGDPATSWASSDSPALPGTLTVSYGDARTMDAVTLATAFGQGQGPTSVDVQTWNGTGWTTQVSAYPLTWTQNTATAQWLRIPLPAAVTTTGIQLTVHAANLTWGHLAVYEVRPSYRAVASSGLGTLSGTSANQLVDGSTATSWASSNSPSLPGAIQIDPGTTRTATSISLAAAFGQGQGPTSVSIEANPGGVWQQVLAPTAITWSSNTGTVETRTLTLPTPVTATQFRVVVRAGNLSYGHIALNEITIQ